MSKEYLEAVDRGGNVLHRVFNLRAFITFISTFFLLFIAQDAFAKRPINYIPPPYYYRVLCSTVTVMPFAFILWLIPLSFLKSYSHKKLLLISLPFVVASIALGVWSVVAWGYFDIFESAAPMMVYIFALIAFLILRNSEHLRKNKKRFSIILAFLTLVSVLLAASDGWNDEVLNPSYYSSMVLSLLAPISMLVLSSKAWWKRIVLSAVLLVIFYVPYYSFYSGIYLSLHTVQDIGAAMGLPAEW